MGAWGVESFDNDAACDWAQQLVAQSDPKAISAAFRAVLDAGNDYLDADAACEALAAAEVVARLRGNWGARNAYTEPIDQWVSSHPMNPSTELVARAVAAIDRVLSEPSELSDLWAESPEFDQWRNSVAQLRARVSS